MSQENVEIVRRQFEAFNQAGIDNGKIARGRQYWNREEALEAAGLRE